MEAYTCFARVYDMYMDNVPYDEWCRQVTGILKEHGITKGIVADIGCGTGNLTERMAEKGFDMIGIDSSADMLEIAMEKKLKSDHNILYLCQDMRSFELYGTCAAMVSRCDAVNYLLTEEDLVTFFRLVNNYLDPGGIFVFDCNTVHKYETVLADNTIAENRESGSFIWENSYDPETGLNEYDLTLYIRNEKTDGEDGNGTELFRRFTETHIQRAFTLEEIKKAVTASGLRYLETFDAETMTAAGSNTERYLIVLEENGKNIG